MNKLKISVLLIICLFLLQSCKGFKPGDAKKSPPDPRERVKRNLEEGKGFRLNDIAKRGRGGDFEFASSNVLWRASLDIIDFMPLLSVDYGGGIIITDWYGEENENDSIKITIQFLSNEVRSDALNIKVFKKKCTSLSNCKVIQSQSDISQELRVAILKRAAQYKSDDVEKNKIEYPVVKDVN
jgi:cytochrome c-type biogenesis protein CcmH/NrfF